MAEPVSIKYNTLDEAITAIREYETSTTTKFVSYKTTKNFGAPFKLDPTGNETKKKKIFWDNDDEKEDDIPFIKLGSRDLDCTYGPSHHQEAKNPKRIRERTHPISTKKINCPASISMREYIMFPDFRYSQHFTNSKARVRARKHMISDKLRWALFEGKDIKFEQKILVNFPAVNKHAGHPTGEMAKEDYIMRTYLSNDKKEKKIVVMHKSKRKKNRIATEMFCKCPTPDNNRTWLLCAGCASWFHPECLKLETPKEPDPFWCKACLLKERSGEPLQTAANSDNQEIVPFKYALSNNPQKQKRGKAYQCLWCETPKIDTKPRITIHIYKEHADLELAPYFCEACSYRCTEVKALTKHIEPNVYPVHAIKLAKLREKGHRVSEQDMLMQSNDPYLLEEGRDYKILSQEESDRHWESRRLATKPKDGHYTIPIPLTNLLSTVDVKATRHTQDNVFASLVTDNTEDYNEPDQSSTIDIDSIVDDFSAPSPSTSKPVASKNRSKYKFPSSFASATPSASGINSAQSTHAIKDSLTKLTASIDCTLTNQTTMIDVMKDTLKTMMAKLEEKDKKLDERDRRFEEREKRLDERNNRIDEREKRLDEKEKKLEEREKKMNDERVRQDHSYVDIRPELEIIDNQGNGKENTGKRKTFECVVQFNPRKKMK